MRSPDRLIGQMARLDGLGPGAHVCCLVDSPAQLEAWTAGCLAEGARRGQKLLRFAPHSRLADLPADGSVTLADPHVAVLAEAPVEPTIMFAMFRREDAAARRQGYRGLRLVADMDWLLAAPPTPARLAEFELLLDEVVAELGATVVCAYRPDRFPSDTIAEMVAVHPATAGNVRTEPGFRIWNVTRGVWEVAGEIDHFNAEPFGRALVAAAGGVSSLRLRAGGLRFVAVAGIQAIVETTTALPHVRLFVDDASAVLHHCWMLLDLHRQLPHVDLRPAATAEPAMEGNR